MQTPRSILLAVLIAGLAGSVSGEAQEASTALATAEKLVDAFNRHDPAAMAALVSEDLELYYVNEKGVAELGTRGREQLAKQMEEYFVDHSTVRSTIVSAVGGPRFVSFREQIVGGKSSLAVYEVEGGLIQRVWYFPSE